VLNAFFCFSLSSECPRKSKRTCLADILAD
jgi:hypothetical protein